MTRTPKTPLEIVIDAVERVTGEAPLREGNSYRALCPAHNDHTPSLGIGVSDEGVVLLNCRSQGCAGEDIIDALGLERHELFPKSGEQPVDDIKPAGTVGDDERAALRAYIEDGQASTLTDTFGLSEETAAKLSDYSRHQWGLDIADVGGFWDRGDHIKLPRPEFLTIPSHFVAVFPFRSFDGQFTGLQARDPKATRDQRRWYGPSGHGWALHSWVRPNPADDERTPIVVCEGVSDTMAVAAAGFIACGVRGAMMTPKAVADGVKRSAGRRPIVVVGDRDEAGSKFAATLAKEIGAPVIEIPLEGKGADLQDWRRQVAKDGGDWTQTLTDAIDEALASQPMGVFNALGAWLADQPKLEWIINEVWAHPGIFVLGARPKMLKSWVGLHAALCIATGRPVFGRFYSTRPMKVALLLAEGHKRALGERLESLARGLGIEDAGRELGGRVIVADESAGVNITDDASWNQLEGDLIRAGVELVVLDTLRAVAPGLQENDAGAVSEMFSRLRRLKAIGITVILVHHFKKSSSNGDVIPSEALSGSGAMFGGVDGALLITDRQERSLSLVWEARDGEPPDEMRVTLDAPQGRFDGTAAATFVVDENPFFDLPDESPRQQEESLAAKVFALVQEHGELTSGHAVLTEVRIAELLPYNLGRLRSPEIREQLAMLMDHVAHGSEKQNAWAISEFLSNKVAAVKDDDDE